MTPLQSPAVLMSRLPVAGVTTACGESPSFRHFSRSPSIGSGCASFLITTLGLPERVIRKAVRGGSAASAFARAGATVKGNFAFLAVS